MDREKFTRPAELRTIYLSSGDEVYALSTAPSPIDNGNHLILREQRENSTVDDIRSYLYVGIRALGIKVEEWYDAVSGKSTNNIGIKRKNVFVVDGGVQSGKTLAAKLFIPFLLGQTPKFKDSRFMYIAFDELIFHSEQTWHERFLQVTRVIIRRLQYLGLVPKNFAGDFAGDIASASPLLQTEVVIAIDEYHMIFADFSRENREALGTAFKAIFLSDNRMYYIVTGSTSPLLWLAMDYAHPGGQPLTHGVVFDTPRYSSRDDIRETYACFRHLHPKDHLRFSEQNLIKSATTCAEAQMVLVYSINFPGELGFIFQLVMNARIQTYCRDLRMYFPDPDIRSYLVALATGGSTQVGPNYYEHNPSVLLRFLHKSENPVNPVYHLRDPVLTMAILLQNNNALKKAGEYTSTYFLLIPIASMIAPQHEEHLNTLLKPFNVDQPVKEQVCRDLCHHASNAGATSDEIHWPHLLQFARNVFCHADYTMVDIPFLASRFLMLFGSDGAVHKALMEVCIFLAGDPVEAMQD